MKARALPAIFLHIPKTGGLTLHDILHRQYTKAEQYSCWNIHDTLRIATLPAEKLSQLRIIKGHLQLGIEKQLPQKMHYFTLLREPFARTISHYNYLKRFKEHPFYAELREKKYSLAQVLEGGCVKNLDNCQVRFLSGDHDLPYGQVAEPQLQKAIRNLDEMMHVFGLLEYYDESILLFSEALNWNTPYYAATNVSGESRKRELSAEESALLSRYNQYDLQLYEHAKTKFMALLEEKGEDFRKRTAAFRRKNSWFSRVATLRRMIAGK